MDRLFRDLDDEVGEVFDCDLVVGVEGASELFDKPLFEVFELDSGVADEDDFPIRREVRQEDRVRSDDCAVIRQKTRLHKGVVVNFPVLTVIVMEFLIWSKGRIVDDAV